MDWNALYDEYQVQLEDFWGRRENNPRYWREATLFGRPLRLSSNHEDALDAFDLSLPLFSTMPANAQGGELLPPFTIQLVVRERAFDPGPLPENLLAINSYTGCDEWLSIHIGGWGHCQVDMANGRAIATLSPALAERPDILSHGLINTILTNFLIGSGYGMLHCTGLLRGGRVLLLVAPHNSGKSTTALRLALAGYQLITDSQVYVVPDEVGFQLLGFPVGKVKLRPDMVSDFPQLSPFLTAEAVRNEMKYSVDLGRLDPDLVCATAVRPASIDLCLLRRRDGPDTTLTSATETAVWQAIMQNSIFYDTATAWQRNLASLQALISCARTHHLVIGSAANGLVAVVDQLWQTS